MKVIEDVGVSKERLMGNLRAFMVARHNEDRNAGIGHGFEYTVVSM